MSTSPSGRTTLRRPNGRLQACDPCHRRKVACDHTQPVCNRCRARDQSDECIYLASDPTAKRRRLSLRYGDDETSERWQSSESQTPRSQVIGDVAPDRTPGFLGSISYNSVYDEAKQTLSLLQGVSSDTDGSQATRQAGTDAAPSVVLQSAAREQCLAVLRTLPTFINSTDWEKINNSHERWSEMAARRIVHSLKSDYSQYWQGSRSDAQLEQMASIISQNTAKPFSDNIDDAEQWLSQFCGPHLRWESLALLFIFRGVQYKIAPAVRKTSDTREIAYGGSWKEGQLLTNVTLGLCIELSRKFSAGNSILLMACVHRTALESQISGDASLSTWQYLAESISLLTFLGFHCEPSTKDYRPSLSSEAKRMASCHAFSMDKVIVFFTGRPPQLSRRYYTTPPPMDLKKGDLLESEEQRCAAANSLDARGWAPDGKVRGTTIARARFLMMTSRDEIIDIALFEGQYTPLETILDMRQRQLSLFQALPEPVVYSPGQIHDLEISTSVLVGRLILKLEHLQNMFVLDRLLLRRGYIDNGELLQTSFEMLSITLLFWRRKDRFTPVLEDLAWMVMAFGTSAGGILCMELLNPTFTGCHPLNKEITRSNIIQHLSLLVAFLDWVPRDGPNADLCQNCRSVVQSILDHALNSTAGANWSPTALENIQLDFNFELLDSFDWMRAGAD